MFNVYSYVASFVEKLNSSSQRSATKRTDDYITDAWVRLQRLQTIQSEIVDSHYWVKQFPKQNKIPEPASKSILETLPNEIIIVVMSYLPISSLCSISLVNKRQGDVPPHLTLAG
jgi:hypothetical protein